MKPVSQILELVVDKIPGYPYHIGYFNDLENEWYNKYGGDMEKVEKKISQIKQNLVKKLVFDHLIIKAQQKAAGNIKTLDKWFSSTSTSNASDDTSNTSYKSNQTSEQTSTESKIDIKNSTRTTSVKKYKQSSLSAFFN
jgi:hypothetical protein